VMQQNT